jgi:hypothetical protein
MISITLSICMRSRSCRLSYGPAGLLGERWGEGVPSNKRMKLTSLAAAPGWQAEVPPRAPRREMEGRSGSQLIRGVLRTLR